MTEHPLYLKEVMLTAPYPGLLGRKTYLAGSRGTVVEEGSGVEFTDVDMGEDLVKAKTADIQAIPPGSVLYRDHRGGLAEAMETVRCLSTLDDLVAHLRPQLGLADTTRQDVAFAPYGPDTRINWTDTHIVTVKGAAVGFSTGPLQ